MPKKYDEDHALKICGRVTLVIGVLVIIAHRLTGVPILEPAGWAVAVTGVFFLVTKI